jgi:hypothetical protein
MTARLTTLACCAVALLLTFGFPPLASAQRTGWDSTRVVKDLPLTPAQRQAFVGSYRVTMPQGDEIRVRVKDENGKLRLRPEGDDESHAMLHQGGNVFLIDQAPDFQLEFIVENGRTAKFTLRKADGLGEGVRVAEAADHATTVSQAAAARDLSLTATERQRYVGTYASELPGGVRITLRVYEENGALQLWVSEPDMSMRLFHQGDNVFLLENAPFVLTFYVANDVAMKIKVHKPEGDLMAVRIR